MDGSRVTHSGSGLAPAGASVRAAPVAAAAATGAAGPMLDDRTAAAQAAATRILVIAAWGAAATNGAVAWGIGASWLVALACAGAFAGLATLSLRLPPATARLCTALGLTGQAMVFTGSFTGNAWQIDTHMLYFAILAALVAMMDISAIVVAAVAIVAHHLALTVVMPSLIYPSSDLETNIARSLLHGAIVAIELAALVASVRARQRLGEETRAQMEAATRMGQAAEAARQEAESATAAARKAQAGAEAASAELATSRRREREEGEARLKLQSEARAAAEAESARRDADAARQRRVVEAMRVAVKAVSDGDLTRRIEDDFDPAYDELRTDFNRMIDALAGMIQAVYDHTGSIDSDTGSISEAAMQLSARTERQAAHLEETAQALSQITDAVGSAAQRAEAARGKSHEARDSAEAGRGVVDSAMETMAEISASSERIFSITSVIDEISFQTNLLALNAGVEAARAGDAGRGFAVVASEVRGLAQRSADAAKEINTLISDSSRLVRKGVSRVEETGQALVKILEQMHQIAEDMTEIAGATQDQSRAIGEANESMRGLGNLTQQVVAMFEETSSATGALKEETKALRGMLNRFRIAPVPAASGRGGASRGGMQRLPQEGGMRA